MPFVFVSLLFPSKTQATEGYPVKKASVLIAMLVVCASQTVLDNKAVAQSNNRCVQVQVVGDIAIVSVQFEPGFLVIGIRRPFGTNIDLIRVGTETTESSVSGGKLIYRWYRC